MTSEATARRQGRNFASKLRHCILEQSAVASCLACYMKLQHRCLRRAYSCLSGNHNVLPRHSNSATIDLSVSGVSVNF